MSGQDTILDGELFGRRLRWWIVISGNGLSVFLLLWLAIATLLGSVEGSDLIRGLLLLTYLLSWILGSNADVTAQREAYLDLQLPTVPRWAVYLVGALTLVGALLIISSGDRYFTVALTAFYATNLVSWYLFKDKVILIHNSSRETVLKKHPDRLELLDAVVRYLTGNWQWFRFAAMLIPLSAAIAASFSEVARELLLMYITKGFPNWRLETLSTGLPLFWFAAFLLIAEAWVWLMRLKPYMARRRLHKEQTKNVAKSRGATRREVTGSSRRVYSNRLQWPRYLWLGHGAAFVLSVKLFIEPSWLSPDYVRICAVMFALGFILAVLSFVSFTIIHDPSANAGLPIIQLREENSRAAKKAWFDFGVSTLLLLVGMVVVTIALFSKPI